MRVGVAVVRGRSMLPTLEDGDRLAVRYDAVPHPEDLVVVRLPDSTVAVKRAMRHDRSGWWVERDNPVEGVDSWAVGSIPDHDVLAVVLHRIWHGRHSRHILPSRRSRREQGMPDS